MFSIEPSPEIWHRDDFPILCNWRKYRRVVEVGVDRAVWASLFLDRWYTGEEWWGVDDWRPYGEMGYDREADYLFAVGNLQRHSHRAKLLRMGSVEAASLFPDGSVDMVYIDGCHEYEAVRADIEAWWPKVSPEGVLAGHDFDEQPVHAGVRQAVTEFARDRDLTVYLTAVPGYGQEACPSWMIYRNGLPGAEWRRC